MFFRGLQKITGDALRTFIAPFFDPMALAMWTMSVGILMLIDPVMVKTLTQWAVFFFTLAGIVVVVSRLTFPMINLRDHVDNVYHRESMPSAVVVLAVLLFMGLALLSVVLWAKA